MRIFMIIVLAVGVLLLFCGFSLMYGTVAVNWPELLDVEEREALVLEFGACREVGRRPMTVSEQIVQVRLVESGEMVSIVTSGCNLFPKNSKIEVVKILPNLRGEDLWALKRSGLNGVDLIFGPLLFLIGVGGTYFGFKRVLFGYPKVISRSSSVRDFTGPL